MLLLPFGNPLTWLPNVTNPACDTSVPFFANLFWSRSWSRGCDLQSSGQPCNQTLDAAFIILAVAASVPSGYGTTQSYLFSLRLLFYVSRALYVLRQFGFLFEGKRRTIFAMFRGVSILTSMATILDTVALGTRKQLESSSIHVVF